MDITTAAREAGTEWMTIVMVAEGGLILLLCYVTSLLFKKRESERDKRDGEVDKKLDAGRDQFSEIRETLKEFMTGLVNLRTSFEQYCLGHRAEHERLNDNIENISSKIDTMSGKIETFPKMLSKIVKIGSAGKEESDDGE